ncbi:hypothetical protein ACWT_2578 [Actinoplanes sp. SE50]|uniref:hypothetical protein n=1 Tax=unclassified Actinoplanes TaxID=2626549 RepID=UPI00023ED206|nr:MULTISPECIES: hypothetical protein [unclassified Actinoplanes]AEV83863.1 hypothetical protein ACPL_2968 [Actinoplanes sp. SE50/110]ATO81993.1 hypothetical protein ACWT_2578 [Actinoplanes sp. SE50]SLL99401.1 hypothetical protein ACSP50_2632 [Actinoplanes sp. SE50/110]
MIRSARLTALPAVAVGGAALWAYGIAVLQPLTEPDSRWWEMAQNSSYWARDLRWGAIVASCLALIVLAGGARWPTRGVAAGGVGWIVVDLLMDRADPGRPALPLTLGVGVLVVATAAVVCTRCGRRTSLRPPVLRTVAVIGVLSAISMLGVGSPSGGEPQLPPTRLAVVLLHIVLAWIATLTAAAPVAASRAAATTGVALGWVVLTVFFAHSPPDALVWLLLAGSGLFVAGIWSVGHPSAPAGLRAAVTISGALIIPIMCMVIGYATIIIGPDMTRMAGNESLNGDEDMLLGLAGVLAGLAVAWCGRAVSRLFAMSPQGCRSAEAGPDDGGVQVTLTLPVGDT